MFPRSQLLFLVLVLSFHLQAQNSQVDAQHYRFDVTLSDASDTIQCDAQLTLRVAEEVAEVRVDLARTMHVLTVTQGGDTIGFEHDLDVLKLPTGGVSGELTYSVHYRGVPEDGLIISHNKFGDRTFFSDHWPDRAREWLAVIDTPADKATCEFVVTAPIQYDVVSNGHLLSIDTLSAETKTTHWKMDYLIPTKVMAMGAAAFETQQLDSMSRAWLYARSGEQGQNYDFEEAPEVLAFMVEQLGDYPFGKLDHVESTTKFGGMENASCIFYSEKHINGNQDVNGLIAHEVAHQWFGNSASESSWVDVWLSEGFATYYEYLYIQTQYGLDSMKALSDENEERIRNYEEKYPDRAILYPNYDHIFELLNPLSYDKAAWMLRLLSYQVGQDVFAEIVKTYYQSHTYGNATTDEFIAVAEKVSGKDLKYFFHQWLSVPGAPDVRYTWKYKRNTLELSFEQQTTFTYQLMIDVPVQTSNNQVEIRQVFLTQKKQTFKLEEVMIHNAPDLDPLNIIYGRIQEKE
ncbi:Peptidase family M1 [Reichenbachiella agariperforans]|uniref:Aminopeptidase N n=1 Tax=Reichenbachiella agariperforans TaxID=156994 RepID=A0A1M6RAT7_REIAG|nr:M1 family metallopeptidase [Reichenbachiella agariperforans]SHK29561.1 Peptidase family M1 [Reichenbachiella agariperforans]